MEGVDGVAEGPAPACVSFEERADVEVEGGRWVKGRRKQVVMQAGEELPGGGTKAHGRGAHLTAAGRDSPASAFVPAGEGTVQLSLRALRGGDADR